MSAGICPRCAGNLYLQDERYDTGWERIPTCLQCSYQVFERTTERPVYVRRQPVLPNVGRGAA